MLITGHRFRFRRAMFAVAGSLAIVAGPTAAGGVTPRTIAAASVQPFPDVITLPSGFAPEGIAIGRGSTFYVGSLSDGSLYRGDLRTGAGSVISAPVGQFSTVGIEVDTRDRVWVAGGISGTGRVYDSSGTLLASFTFTPAFDSFVNDVVVTPSGAWFTDSGTRQDPGSPAGEPRLFFVPLGPAGALPEQSAVRTVPVDAADLAFPNLNGIESFGGRLLVGHSTAETLYWVDPETGHATPIDIGMALPGNDGIIRRGATVYVVQNSEAQITGVTFGAAGTARVTGTFPVSGADTPTTAGLFGNSLYAVDARFVQGNDPYRIFRVPLH